MHTHTLAHTYTLTQVGRRLVSHKGLKLQALAQAGVDVGARPRTRPALPPLAAARDRAPRHQARKPDALCMPREPQALRLWGEHVAEPRQGK